MMSRLLLSGIFFILAAGPACARAWAQTEDEYEARLTSVKGEAAVFTAEDPEGGPGVVDMPLAIGDKVKTGANSSAEVSFSGEHSVFLRSNSEFTIASARRGDCELKLAWGGLLAAVRALSRGGFRVRTPTAVAAVRGTEFAVEVAADNPEETHVGVFDEGQVEVRGETGPPELLKANQETMVRRGAGPLAAYQLKRFVPQRRFMRNFRKRVLLIRKNWRRLPPERRQELRRRLMERMRELRQERQERREKLRERAQRPSQRLRDDQKLMQERKNAIRRRRQGRQP